MKLNEFSRSKISDKSITREGKDKLVTLVANMVYIPGGEIIVKNNTVKTFRGSKVHEASPCTIKTDSFYINKYPVTQEEWEIIMGKENNPSTYSVEDVNLPVYNVTYEDCQRFIIKLNRITGLKFSLPKESQWNFAAHGGKVGGYDLNLKSHDEIDEIAWYEMDMPFPVGMKVENPLGLYDMYGNVDEYCRKEDGTEILKGGNIASERIYIGQYYHYEDYWDEDGKIGCSGLRLFLNE